MGKFIEDLDFLHLKNVTTENIKKIKDFSSKYNVKDENGELSYKKCINLIKKYLYYNLEDKYVEFILDFHKSHNTTDKIYPPRLVFRKMKKEKTNKINISLSECRKFKISEILKNDELS